MFDAGGLPAESANGPVTGEPLTQTTAGVFAFLTAIRTSIAGIPIAVMAGIVAAPMWLPSLRRYRGGVALAVAVAIAVAWGIALTALQAPYNGGTSTRTLLNNSLLPVYILGGCGTILWAREQLSERTVIVAVGLGLFATGVLNGSISPSHIQWKSGLFLPVTVLVLALASGARRWQAGLAVLLGLGATNVLLDSRSAFALCVLSAILFVSQRQWSNSHRGSIRSRALSLTLAAATAAVALYQVVAHLLMAGYLGEEAQQRSLMQEELSGSMLIGGRPEIAATWALMRHRPAGFGAGAVASTEDVLVAKSGMWGINYQPDNGYVEGYMFGRGGISLHSNIGDMWASFGFAGIALSLVIIGLLAHALVIRLATGTASALTIYMVCSSFWNMPFSPLWGSTPFLAIALGVVLLQRVPASPASLFEEASDGAASHAAQPYT